MPGVLAALLLVLPPGTASAQSSEPRFSVSAGVGWNGGANAGERDANETTSAGGTYRLFASETELGATTGIEASLGLRLARFIHAELIASFGQVALRSHISSDVEGIPDTDASESIGELTVEASAMIHLAVWQLPRRAMPYIAAGGGYLRHLHEGRMLVETGAVYHVGGGILVPLTSPSAGRTRTTALRFDARARVRKGGAFPDDTPRTSPSVAVSFVWKF